MGLRTFKPLNRDITPLEDAKKYYFIFEGSNTEVDYFKGIANHSKEIEISNMIEIIILEKEANIKTTSAPNRLLEFAKNKKEELKTKKLFNDEIVEFVLVFDRDSFKPVDKKENEYISFINEAKEHSILAVTSPCFENMVTIAF